MTIEDMDAILQLLQVSLETPGMPRTKEFWNWKHIQNPFGASPGLVAESEGKLIGLRVFLLWNWKSSDRVINAARAVDTVVHPEWRGRGIFSLLTSSLIEELRSSGVSFIFNTPNSSSLPGYLKLGWQVIRRLPLLFKPLKPFRMILGLIRTPTEETTLAIPDTGGTDCLESNHMEDLFAEWSNDSRLHTTRNKNYFFWRYRQIPGFQYSIKCETKGDAAAAGIFRQRRRKALLELSVSELLLTSSPDGLKLAAKLLADAFKESSADYAIALAAAGTTEHIALRKCGFFPIGNLGPVFVTKKLNELPSGIDLKKWDHWRCSIGDLEIF